MKGDRATVWATIGTAYPVKKWGDKGYMTYLSGSSHEYVASFGIGVDTIPEVAGLHFENSGSRTIERGFGFDWRPRKANRSFRVAVRYREWKNYGGFCEGDGPPYVIAWRPVKLIGTTGAKRRIPEPNFSHCYRQRSAGRWYRFATTGSSYSYASGVKIADTIGIELSSKRAYNNEARLVYDLTRKGLRSGKYLCGNNDVPAYAGKISEKPLV
ncbi:MAG: hypothetical protein ACRCYQ_00585 [Nocardioides sp.]